jgi:ComF family protein
MKFLEAFIQLIYPRLCPACQRKLLVDEGILCAHCMYYLPKTNYHQHDDHPLQRIFWGRVAIENVTAFFFFEKGSSYRKVLHHIKYHGQKKLGYEMGRLFGLDLCASPFLQTDMVVPVPLHRKKEKKRGFNQSTVIAKGIADALGKPVWDHVLVRTFENPTQTSKSRYERWENVEGIFKVTDPEFIEGQHVLLVDDVLTTGATLEASTQALRAVPGVKVSIAVLAYALEI